ncbi:MAG: hypothetical protein PHD70_14210 [Anaerostipes sp.]|nr:hypothetical protein [Anaerostipes sp.]
MDFNIPDLKLNIPNIEFPDMEIPETHYEDTFFSDMAEDIKSSQDKTTEQLNILIDENRKSEKSNRRIVIATLVISILTLIATVVGIVIQFF